MELLYKQGFTRIKSFWLLFSRSLSPTTMCYFVCTDTENGQDDSHVLCSAEECEACGAAAFKKKQYHSVLNICVSDLISLWHLNSLFSQLFGLTFPFVLCDRSQTGAWGSTASLCKIQTWLTCLSKCWKTSLWWKGLTLFTWRSSIE